MGEVGDGVASRSIQRAANSQRVVAVSGAIFDRHTKFGLRQCGFSFCDMRRPRVAGPQSNKAWATSLACYWQKLFSQVAHPRVRSRATSESC
jgi:hypothetical protein